MAVASNRSVAVTGAAGFVGGRLLARLSNSGWTAIGVDLPGRGFLDHEEFLSLLERRALRVEAIAHQGALADTMETDHARLWRLNFDYSRALFDVCRRDDIRLVYASSAAVYGRANRFVEAPCAEQPLGEYAASKLAFDRYAADANWCRAVGLRYFNVYGPGEAHKGRMASVAYQAYNTLRAGGVVRLFGASHGFAAGMHRRDFVHIDDVVRVVSWFLTNEIVGVFNVGTACNWDFRSLVEVVMAHVGRGAIEFVDMPPALRETYQPLTLACVERLRRAGYLRRFIGVREGVSSYLRWLDQNQRGAA